MSLENAIYDRLPGSAPMRSAVVRETDPLRVDHGAGAVSAQSAMPGYRLEVGERVTVMLSGDRVFVVGSRASRPQLGTVQTVGAGVVSVLADDTQLLTGLPYVGVAPSVGAQVALTWGAAGAVVLGALGVAPPPPSGPAGPTDPDPTPAPPSGTSGVASGSAVEVRTARSGSWRSDGRAAVQAYQGHWTTGNQTDNLGFLFFGGALAVAGGVADPGAATVTVSRDTSAGVGQAREIRVQGTPAGRGGSSPPALTGPAYTLGSLARGSSATFPLPDGLAQGFLDGSLGGLALVKPGSTDYLSILGLSAPGTRQPTVRIPYTGG